MRLVDHLEKLVVFKTIADSGSLSQAARVLKVSQPSLTKTVQHLEEALEAPLFIRLRQGVRLTEVGETLYAYAESIVKTSTQAEERIRKPAKLPSGSLSIVTYAPLAAAVYPRIVEFLDRECPTLHATMRTHTSTHMLLAWVVAREGDIAIVVSDKRDTSLVEFGFETVTFGFYVGKAATRDKKTTSLDELKSSRLVCMGSSFAGANRSLRDVLAEVDLHESVLLVDSHEIARGFALRNAGVAVLPDILAEPYVGSGSLYRLPIRGAWAKRLGEHRLSAVVRADEAKRRSVAYFLEHFCRRSNQDNETSPH